MCAVIFYCSSAYTQNTGNFFVRFPFGDEFYDFPFTGGKDFKIVRVISPAHLNEIIGKVICEDRGDENAPFPDLCYRHIEFGVGVFFQKITISTGYVG